RSILPEGSVESTTLGSHYLIRATYAHDYFHGKVRLNRFSSEDLRCLMTLMREKGSVPERDRIIFLDTETTGIQGGTGMCPFLVGVGFFSGAEFQIVQVFIRDFDEEPSMLLALTQLLERFKLVITYNGAAFDIPLLETRFTLARLDNPFENLSHYDLLFTTRRLWRHGHGSCRLTALEREMISFFRGPDIPGEMAIAGGLPAPVRRKALENLSIVCRRAGDHDRSRELCCELIRHPEFSMTGYESAAIYYERIARDFEVALRVLEEGLARANSE